MNLTNSLKTLSIHSPDPQPEAPSQVSVPLSPVGSNVLHDFHGSIPSTISLPDGRLAKIDSFKLAVGQEKSMLAALLKPVGAVSEGTDLPSQLLYSSDSVCYRYKAKVNSLKTTEAAHQFNVLIEIDRRGNLRRLAAQSPTYPGPTGENFTYKMEFFSHSEPTNILLKLPNELLLNIAAYTGTDGQGTELNLRAVNRQLKSIADKSLSSVQDFVITHGKVLEASGYEGWEMHALAIQPVDEQNFLLSNNRENLYGAGYHGYEMNELANQPVDQQKFVLDNLNTLKAAGYEGYEGYEMNELARRPTDEQLFVLNNYLSLKEEGYNGWAMNNLAAQPDVERNAVLQNVKQM